MPPPPCFAGFRPSGRVPFPRGKGTIRRWGTPQGRTSFAMSAFPTPSGPSGHLPLTGGVGPQAPIYGGYPLSWAKYFRRAKFEWVSEFIPAHWGLGLQKLGQMRFRRRAWHSRTNAPGPVLAVGATLVVARKPSPLGEGAPEGGG